MLLSEEGNSRGRALWLAALLVCSTAIAYLPALKGGFIWDDDSTLTENSVIGSADGLYRFWCTTEPADYWPVTSSTLWIEWRLWGMHALGYHATNLALHIGEALLLWAILRRLRMPGAWLAAFIFALHPVNVESVAWIAQRKNLMAMLFFLLSIFWFLKTDPASPMDPGRLYRPGAGRWYGLSLLAFAFGMLSKGSVAMLPMVLLGLIAWHRRLAARDLVRTAPFFFVAAVFVLVDIWFQHHGVALSIRSADSSERLLGAGAVVWFYLYKALVPLNLIFVYPQWHIRVDNPLWWAPLLAAAAMTLVLWRCRKRWSRPALFAWSYFCVMLVPVMGFTDVYFMKYSLVADHYQHIAIIGPIVLASAGLALALGRLQQKARVAVQVSAVLLVGTFGILTWRQCQPYGDIETFYRTIIAQNPSCWMAYNNLGTALPATHRLPEVIALFEESLRLEPRYPEVHFNLGWALQKAGRTTDAIVRYEEALQLKPHYADAHNALGMALVANGRTAEAIAHYEEALQLKPDRADVHGNLGAALADENRSQEALEQFKEAVRLKPDYADAHSNLGVALANENRLQEALEQFQEAVRLDPSKAQFHHNLGSALQDAGRPEEAKAQFDAEERLKADQPEPGHS